MTTPRLKYNKNHYYPFGLKHQNYNTGIRKYEKVNSIPRPIAINKEEQEYKYKYNGKEFQEELGLDWYDYGARNYDASLGRWMNVDPLAEKYGSISPYAFVANTPTSFLDPDGREIIITGKYKKDKDGNYILNADGNRILTQVNITITGKVINFSNNDVNMEEAIGDINSYIEEAFGGDYDGVKVNVSSQFEEAKEMDDVRDSDHLLVLSEPGEIANKVDASGMAAGFYEKVAFLDADYFTGWYDRNIGVTGERSAAHELGHLFGLKHDSHGLMKSGGFRNRVYSEQISHIIRHGTKSNNAKNTDERGLPYRGLVTPSIFRMENIENRFKSEK